MHLTFAPADAMLLVKAVPDSAETANAVIIPLAAATGTVIKE